MALIVSFWKKHLALFVVAFGVIGYMLSWMFADKSWLVPGQQPDFYQMILFLKTLFFASLKMLVAPIVFFSLLAGIFQLGKVAELGRLGRYTLIYYLSTTAIAIVIGLVVVFFIHPWESPELAGVEGPKVAQEFLVAPEKVIDKSEGSAFGVAQKMAGRIFVNPIKAFAENNILGVVFWALLFGIGWLKLQTKGEVFVEIATEIHNVLIKVLEWVIVWAPFGVFAVGFDFQLKFSSTVLNQLLSFCLVVFGATLIHGGLVLPMILKFFGGMGVRRFFKDAAEPLAIAFGSSSSAATLPVSLKVSEEKLGVSSSVSSFVLPLGATMNMDGTALFEGVAAVFLAYIFGIDLGTVGMLSVFLMAVVSSVGAPGMPSGSMSGMQMVLIAAGIPLEGIGLLLLVERPLDTFRTAVNVQGDLIGSVVVQNLISKNEQ